MPMLMQSRLAYPECSVHVLIQAAGIYKQQCTCTLPSSASALVQVVIQQSRAHLRYALHCTNLCSQQSYTALQPVPCMLQP